MKIGVISEGHSDRAVITNVITGITNLDRSSIEALRPIYTKDETDRGLNKPMSFSSWSIVKQECQNRELIDVFLSIEGQDFVVIHLDSAECADYGVQRAAEKIKLRDLIIAQINTWIAKDLTNYILYAIAVEEIDAWLLTIYEKSDSSTSATPKEKLNKILRKKNLNSTKTYENFLTLSKVFSKTRDIMSEKCLAYNHSLAAFYDEVTSKVLPRLSTKKDE
jgi:hypothetical protein